jgi:ArsR family transcriptional regulator
MAATAQPIVIGEVQPCCTPLVSEPLNAAEAERLAPLFKALADRSGCGCFR